jgi:hypothetical protein
VKSVVPAASRAGGPLANSAGRRVLSPLLAIAPVRQHWIIAECGEELPGGYADMHG